MASKLLAPDLRSMSKIPVTAALTGPRGEDVDRIVGLEIGGGRLLASEAFHHPRELGGGVSARSCAAPSRSGQRTASRKC